MTAPAADSALRREGPCLVLPALVRGELVLPPRIAAGRLAAASAASDGEGPAWLELEEARVLRLMPGAAGDPAFLALPRVDPRSLIERNPGRLAPLHDLPVAEVLDYVAALRRTLSEEVAALCETGAAASAIAAGIGAPRFYLELLPELLDAEALGESIDRELSGYGHPGRRFLDGWAELDVHPAHGITARMRERLFGVSPRRPGRPCLRAMPTRQLHLTAGNSPLIPALSLLRALATKGAAVVKSPSEAVLPGALLAAAMHRLDAHHPITRHTSLVHWRGGDRGVEDVLLERGAFDRLVVWGDTGTLASVTRRAAPFKTVLFQPRYGVSLIGREAFPGQVAEAAELAAADSLISDQRACTASLVHYVEAAEAGAERYCRMLQQALARWDERLPARPSAAARAALRRLRRGELLEGRWLTNGPPDEITSAVVYAPRAFDLAAHPQSRLVVVRRLDRLEDALPLMSSAVATAGVFPEPRRRALRGALAAAGVSNVLPLGEVERGYPGIPHDGLRVLAELVNWVNG
jgi:hypothetical protein